MTQVQKWLSHQDDTQRRLRMKKVIINDVMERCWWWLPWWLWLWNLHAYEHHYRAFPWRSNRCECSRNRLEESTDDGNEFEECWRFLGRNYSSRHTIDGLDDRQTFRRLRKGNGTLSCRERIDNPFDDSSMNAFFWSLCFDRIMNGSIHNCTRLVPSSCCRRPRSLPERHCRHICWRESKQCDKNHLQELQEYSWMKAEAKQWRKQQQNNELKPKVKVTKAQNNNRKVSKSHQESFKIPWKICQPFQFSLTYFAICLVETIN